MEKPLSARKLVIFGASNMVSDLFDCALACGMEVSAVVLHHAEAVGLRDVSLAQRVRSFAAVGQAPAVLSLDAFLPGEGESYLLGPTTPERAELALLVETRFGLRFGQLVHPTAYVSPLARLGEGVFIGARSVVAPGVVLDEHVFVNRAVTIGHDTRVGAFSRLQPGSNIASLSKIGVGVTVGIGSTTVERLEIGDHSMLAAGAVVTKDVPARTLAMGLPARHRSLDRSPAEAWIAEWLTVRGR